VTLKNNVTNADSVKAIMSEYYTIPCIRHKRKEKRNQISIFRLLDHSFKIKRK